MKQSHHVSVIIPTCNRHERTCRAVASVAGGTLKPDEIIVVDDGSVDGTADAVEGLGVKAVNVIRLERNGGVSRARNVGLAAARNRWVALLDSDDVWLPKHLDLLVAYLAENPACQIVQSYERWYRKGQRVLPRKVHRPSAGNIFEASLKLCLVSSSAVLFDRTIVDDAGGYDERMPVCEDYDLWIRLARNHSFGLVPEETITKDGPRSDQLSKQFWGMDRFRVFSMVKLLSDGLSGTQADVTRQICLEKLAILSGGAHRRGNTEAERAYGRWSAAVKLSAEWLSTVSADPYPLPKLLLAAGFKWEERGIDPILSALRALSE